MRRIFCVSFFVIIGATLGYSQSADTLKTTRSMAVKVVDIPLKRVDVMPDGAKRREIFGEYSITGYAILCLKTPSSEELNRLVGSLVKIQNTTITGSLIDPLTFSIYEIERLQRDDYIYRTFGREIKTPEPDLPANFAVHKTDNERCYGIVEIGDGRLAIPYKGVLLYLTRQ